MTKHLDHEWMDGPAKDSIQEERFFSFIIYGRTRTVFVDIIVRMSVAIVNLWKHKNIDFRLGFIFFIINHKE